MPDHSSNNNQTVIGRFLDQVIANPDQIAFQFSKDEQNSVVSVSYGQTAASVALLVKALRDLAISPGDHVVQIAENSFQWIVWDFALQFHGAVHVPISPGRSGKEISLLIEHCQPKIVVLESLRLLSEMSQQGTDFSKIIVASNDNSNLEKIAGTGFEIPIGSEVPIGFEIPNEITQPSENEITDSQISCLQEKLDILDPEKLMSILYTSGTTGRPKGVMLSHRNLAANVQSLLKVSPIRKDETRLCVLPLSHIYARTNDLYSTVSSGATLALGDPKNMAESCRMFQPTFVNGVPYLFDKCMKQFQIQKGSDSLINFLGGKIEKVNSGGAPIGIETDSFFRNNSIPMTTGYGLTETSPVLAASSVANHKMGTVGKVIPGVDLKVGDDGEILARGKNVMLGYFHDPELTDKCLVDGWLHTGDLGMIDDEGFVTIVGRKDEMIVSSTGRNIMPSDLEKLISMHPLINQVCVTGRGKPLLTAIVCLKQTDTFSEKSTEQLKTEINDLLVDRAAYERIAKLIFAEEEFSVANGLLTIKGGLRRSEIEKRWAAES